MSPTHQDLSNDTTFSQIKSRFPVPLNILVNKLTWDRAALFWEFSVLVSSCCVPVPYRLVSTASSHWFPLLHVSCFQPLCYSCFQQLCDSCFQHLCASCFHLQCASCFHLLYDSCFQLVKYCWFLWRIRQRKNCFVKKIHKVTQARVARRERTVGKGIMSQGDCVQGPFVQALGIVMGVCI